MKHWILRAAVSVALVALAVPAFGQTSRMTGIVTDTAGGVIPGADVEIRHNATGVTTTTVTNHEGVFSFPGIQTGTYTVTVTLEGFKTAVYNDVVLNAGVPTNVNARLEVGGLAETVTVEGATALVQTVSSAVSSTINTTQIESLPLTSRNVLDFVVFLPGVQTSGGNRQSSINGLPRAAINITLDGINVQDNTLRTSDGFFTIVQPRLDAIEEVTVSTAAGEAVGGGQGAVQIRFTTRSGTNTYSGSLYHYYRNDALNENTWFNKRNDVDKADLLQHQRGGRFGGPIRIPGLYDGRGKAFFFLNIENFYQPSEVTRNRTIFHEQARAGFFRYDVGGGNIGEVNLMELAAANGQIATMDPTIQRLLADIRQATGTTGSVTSLANPLHERYSYNVTAEANNWFPTYRIDYNFTNNHRFSTVLNWHTFSSVPDTLNSREPFFPGFPVMGSQTSRRGSSSNTLRSTFGANFVNEARVAYQGSPVEFFNEQFNTSLWDNQQGFHLNLGAGGITSAGNTPIPQSRNVNTIRVENTLSWLKGAHNITIGGSFDRLDSWNKFQTPVPTIAFGLDPSDPALGMFTTGNIPGASAAQLTAARNMYALLTGRVTSLSGVARVDAGSGRYVFSGLGLEESRLDDWGFYAQDSWRVRPNLSLNLGVRYDVQAPFRARNSSYATATIDSVWGVSGYRPGCDLSNATPATCNLFKPGEMPGQPTVYERWDAGTPAYNVDWNNFAPSVGVNWSPERRDGLLGRLMGASGDFVIRGGFSRAFQRNGMSDYRARFAGNPGLAISVARNQSQGNLGTIPLLLRESSRLTPPDFPAEPVFPNEGLITHTVNAMDPNIQVPYADTWTIGLQRGLTRNMAAEVRYVGTRSRQQWTTYNYNELNIIESGILHEFRLAQQNLEANLLAGRGGNFRYFGPGTGTHPLPTILAYFSGAVDPNNPAAYGSALFQNATFLNPLAKFNPNPYTFGNNLDNNAARRANALAAGLPANLLRANPHKLNSGNNHGNSALVTGHGGFSNYNSVQFELRRRLANGVQVDASYVYGVGDTSVRYSFRVPRETRKRAGLTEGEVTHGFKMNWMLELPFGQGRRFAANAGGVLDRIIGGWQLHGNGRVQSGSWVDFGNVRMVGFNEKDLRKMFKLRINENQRVFMLPQDVIDNTVRAFSTLPTSVTGYGGDGPPSGRYFAPAMGPDCIEMIAAGYGECGTRTLAVRGPMLKEFDVSVVKMVPLVNRVRAEFRVEMLNAFNNVNFVPTAFTHTTVTNPNVTNPAAHEVSSLRGTNIARVIQLVSRISW
jgi:hypothetical protein